MADQEPETVERLEPEQRAEDRVRLVMPEQPYNPFAPLEPEQEAEERVCLPVEEPIPEIMSAPARRQIYTPQATGSIVAGSDAILSPRLSRGYTIEDRAGVGEFLDTYPFLEPLLLEAHQQIHTYFPQANVVLEVFTDPEFGDAPKLVAAINPAVPPDEAVTRYRQFQRAWWVSASPQAHGLLVIMPEYR